MMAYNQSDSDGTDDDNLLPTQVVQSQSVPESRPRGNGKPANSFDIDQQIRQLELHAYLSMLKAFSAQSEVITWSKEELITRLRMELRVEVELHLEMLEKVENDEILRRIKTWRQAGMPLHHRDTSPSPQSSKRQKATPILPPPAPMLKPAPQSLPSALQLGGLSSEKKPRSKGVADIPIPPRVAGTPRPSSGRGGLGNGRGSTPWRNHKGTGPSTDSRAETCVGRRIRIKWPADNKHYEASIVDYDKESMHHCVAFDTGTPQESREWVDLKAMDKNDMQWLSDPRTGPVVFDGKVPTLNPPERGAGRGMKRGRGAYRGVVGRPKGSGQRGRPALDKSALAPTPQSRPWRGGAPVEEDRNGVDEKGRQTHIQYPEAEIVSLVNECTELENVKDLEKLEVVRQSAREYEGMLQKGLAVLSEHSDKKGQQTHIQYPEAEIEALLKEYTELDHAKDPERLEAVRRSAQEYESLLERSLEILALCSDGGSEDERVDVVDSPNHSVGIEKEPHSVSGDKKLFGGE